MSSRDSRYWIEVRLSVAVRRALTTGVLPMDVAKDLDAAWGELEDYHYDRLSNDADEGACGRCGIVGEHADEDCPEAPPTCYLCHEEIDGDESVEEEDGRERHADCEGEDQHAAFWKEKLLPVAVCKACGQEGRVASEVHPYLCARCDDAGAAAETSGPSQFGSHEAPVAQSVAPGPQPEEPLACGHARINLNTDLSGTWCEACVDLERRAVELGRFSGRCIGILNNDPRHWGIALRAAAIEKARGWVAHDEAGYADLLRQALRESMGL